MSLRTRTEPPLARAALAGHGIAHLLGALAVGAWFAGSVRGFQGSTSAWLVYLLLLGAAIAYGVAGAIAIAASRSCQASQARCLTRLAGWYAVAVLFTGALFVAIEFVAQTSPAPGAAGALWITAAATGLYALQVRKRFGAAISGLLGAMAAVLWIIGHSLLDLPITFPVSHWAAATSFLSSAGILGAVALLVASLALPVRAALHGRRGPAAMIFGVGMAIYGVATLLPSVRFLMEFEWDGLDGLGSAAGTSWLSAGVLFLFVCAFGIWVLASGITVVAGTSLASKGWAAFSIPRRPRA